ncbi:MAG: UvrD-helicase domain-containing protein, partial [Planctomycetota bacterium]
MTAPDIFANLTPTQKEAVMTTTGPLLIIAGAGSGKTRVVTQRIAYLIQQKVDPHRILAITFTNKAAGEMKERICHYAQGEKVWVSTFHAFCAKILRRHAEVLGYSRHYLIYDTEDKKALIQAVLEEKKLGDYLKRYSLGKLSGEISAIKQTLLVPNQTYSLPTPLDEIFPLYQERLQRADAMDFEDLLSKTILLFETNPEILKHYQEFFQYISVDEYQDTNPIQAEIIFLL